MSTGWIDEIESLANERDMTLEALAIRAGLHRSYFRKTRERKSDGPKEGTRKKIAKALNIEPDQLPPSTEKAPAPGGIDYIRVVGEIAAGQWREVSYTDFDEYHIPGIIDDRWNPQDVFALVVKGNSINRQAKDGSYVVCLQAYAAPRGMRDGDWVVVERARGDLIETTVKRAVAMQDGGWSLRPDSDDPRHQEDIPLDAERCAGCDEVRVSAYVLDFIKPATRF